MRSGSSTHRADPMPRPQTANFYSTSRSPIIRGLPRAAMAVPPRGMVKANSTTSPTNVSIFIAPG
jgi:hypothetical protein